MAKLTHRIHLRVNDDEARKIYDNAARFSSVSHYVRTALASYNNLEGARRLELLCALGAYYVRFRDELSRAGSNLNQAVKRANELAIAGMLPEAYIKEMILPSVNELQKTIAEMKRDLQVLSKKASKL